MFSDKNKNQTCEFAEETISYLYGEIESGEKSKIETHLSVCAICARETAAFAVVRSSISEWKVSRFDRLKTPVIELPSAESVNAAKILLAEKVRAYFSYSPRLTASASLATLSIFAAVLFFYNRTGEQTVAENFNRNSVVTTAPPAGLSNANAALEQVIEKTNAAVNNETGKIVANSEFSESSVADNKKSNGAFLEKARPAKKNPATAAFKPREETVNSSVLPKSRRENRIASRRTKKPTLADSNDADEDDSLRLADIFEEISMR